MRTPTASAVVVALALAACSPDGPRSLLAPTASNAAAGDRAAVAAMQTMSIHGDLDAVESATPQPAPPAIPTQLVTHLDGSGTASHLGRYTVAADFRITLATSSSVGLMTFTAANGDVLTTTMTGHAVPTDGGARITETATITGGTGRFANATGTLAIQRLESHATGISAGSFDGTINLAR
jgi:hypothetical protein